MTAGVNRDTSATGMVAAPTPPPRHASAPPAEAEIDPQPIFVDMTGRRRRLMHRAAVASLAVLGAYGVAVALSFLGGPVPPSALLPLPAAPHAASSAAATVRPNAAATSTAGNAAGTGAGQVPGATPLSTGSVMPGAAPSVSPSPAASASPTGSRRTPPARATRTASPGTGNGHGH